MKLLAIDTATEQCSAAMVLNDRVWSRVLPTARGHADSILPMVHELLIEAGCSVRQLDCIAFGRGPGSFTGVRIAVSVAQGLAFGASCPVVGISNLAAVAQQAAREQSLKVGDRIAVCMDARMKEVYWAEYRVGANRVVELEQDECVIVPDTLKTPKHPWAAAVGTGWIAYPELARLVSLTPVAMLPRAAEVAQLAEVEFKLGRAVPAAAAAPVYLRDDVVKER